LFGNAGRKGDQVGVKNNKDDNVDGGIGCDILSDANAKTDKGEDGTGRKRRQECFGQ